MLIKLELNTIFFSKKLLGTDTAWLWIGMSWDALDDDDHRVKATRALMEQYYMYVPFGMWVGNRMADGSMSALKDDAGYYRVDVSWWPVGEYRMNLHTSVGEPSQFNAPPDVNKRDHDVSWAPIHTEQWSQEENSNIRPFLHKEENNTGYSLRILIRPSRSIEALGDAVS